MNEMQGLAPHRTQPYTYTHTASYIHTMEVNKEGRLGPEGVTVVMHRVHAGVANDPHNAHITTHTHTKADAHTQAYVRHTGKCRHNRNAAEANQDTPFYECYTMHL